MTSTSINTFESRILLGDNLWTNISISDGDKFKIKRDDAKVLMVKLSNSRDQ